MLEIKELTCGYDSKFSLKDISFNLGDREVLGIIGPNGSGKTTLLRAMTRMLAPKKGAIILQGRDISRFGLKELAQRIAVVSQDFTAVPMSVEEFVLLGRIPHFEALRFLETRKDIEIAQKSMDLTDTLKLKGQLVTELSGGERQLALIARALAQEPKLLLLDEPTTHLDITHQVGILDLIKRLNRELALTVVMVLHDLNLASEYCNRLILLDEGRVHKMGVPDEVLKYQIIEEVYKTVVVEGKNPISQRPYILVVSEEERRNRDTK
ncbi:MAG: ABC transporter ATP-binding protein [Candidatus Omnitrophica bacterium]|nr:ABC transporter ATP-binding protein [Candidatus Omnitrophota bacterium]